MKAFYSNPTEKSRWKWGRAKAVVHFRNLKEILKPISEFRIRPESCYCKARRIPVSFLVAYFPLFPLPFSFPPLI